MSPPMSPPFGLAGTFVLQEYVMNPMTYQGNKFDLRVWAMVTSLDPLRIYLLGTGIPKVMHAHAHAHAHYSEAHCSCRRRYCPGHISSRSGRTPGRSMAP